MHFKNGREAKNGDKVVLIPSWGSPVIGILYDAAAGNDYCNGKIAPISPQDACPNLNECFHLDDILSALPAVIPDSSVVPVAEVPASAAAPIAEVNPNKPHVFVTDETNKDAVLCAVCGGEREHEIHVEAPAAAEAIETAAAAAAEVRDGSAT